LIDSAKLSDSGICNLIFTPGLSTAEQVTDLSGRGVGLDVVKRNIEAVRGRIEITSEPGRGCTFRVRLPLTLAITDGMLVKVGQERYIVPTVNIHLSFQPNAEALSTVAGRGEMVMLRGEPMPIVRLHRLFEVADAKEDPTQGLLVVVADGNRRCALLVDELLGQQQVVAKSLGAGIGKVQGISGGAILGDGRIGLILDPAEIVALARRASGPTNRQHAKYPPLHQAAFNLNTTAPAKEMIG
jgi:two-component system, chemotaxis family, sensor kinase CheA